MVSLPHLAPERKRLQYGTKQKRWMGRINRGPVSLLGIELDTLHDAIIADAQTFVLLYCLRRRQRTPARYGAADPPWP